MNGVQQCGVHLSELEGEVVFAAELELLAEGAISAEIEQLVNAAGAGVEPGAGFFAFVQSLKLPGRKRAEVIEVKPEAVEGD